MFEGLYRATDTCYRDDVSSANSYCCYEVCAELACISDQTATENLQNTPLHLKPVPQRRGCCIILVFKALQVPHFTMLPFLSTLDIAYVLMSLCDPTIGC